MHSLQCSQWHCAPPGATHSNHFTQLARAFWGHLPWLITFHLLLTCFQWSHAALCIPSCSLLQEYSPHLTCFVLFTLQMVTSPEKLPLTSPRSQTPPHPPQWVHSSSSVSLSSQHLPPLSHLIDILWYFFDECPSPWLESNLIITGTVPLLGTDTQWVSVGRTNTLLGCCKGNNLWHSRNTEPHMQKHSVLAVCWAVVLPFSSPSSCFNVRSFLPFQNAWKVGTES